MYSVRHIVNVGFLGQVTRPQGVENIPAYQSVQFAYPVDLLGQIGSQKTHGKFLMGIAHI
jgi:hypothetical protein